MDKTRVDEDTFVAVRTDGSERPWRSRADFEQLFPGGEAAAVELSGASFRFFQERHQGDGQTGQAGGGERPG